ncbi:MAG: TolC family protein [bacterium]|nr:TolC family protein [bacterium]
MKKKIFINLIIIAVFFIINISLADDASMNEKVYSLKDVIDFALKNNPGIISGQKDIEIENYSVRSAEAERMPRIDFTGGYTKYEYKTPVTPIVFTSGPINPVVDNDIYNAGVTLKIPLYRGGRLSKGIEAARVKKLISENNFNINRNELIYNLTGIYYKIIQMEKLFEASETSVKQLEAHKNNVELYLKSGTVPKIDLLKTEVELLHAKENRLIVKNNLESAYEILKTFMGVTDMNKTVLIEKKIPEINEKYSSKEESIDKAFSLRPDYKSMINRKIVAKDRIQIAEGKRLPDFFLSGQYIKSAGDNLVFKENWIAALTLSMPILDWGITGSEIKKERSENEKINEDERAMRLNIIREVKNAYRDISTAKERIDVTEKAIESANEALKIELLKFDTGSGTSTDVLDAQAALLRAETDYYQALYDRMVADALLKKVIGENNE